MIGTQEENNAETGTEAKAVALAKNTTQSVNTLSCRWCVGVERGGVTVPSCLKTLATALLGDRGRLFWEKNILGVGKHGSSHTPCSGLGSVQGDPVHVVCSAPSVGTDA